MAYERRRGVAKKSMTVMTLLAPYRYICTCIRSLVNLIKRPMERDYDRELASLSEDSLINYAYFFPCAFFRIAGHLNLIMLRVLLMHQIAENSGTYI